MKTLKFLPAVLLAMALTSQCRLFAEDANNEQKASNENQESPAKLSAAELREKRERGLLEQKIETLFRRTKPVKGNERPHIDDYFVVAKFQMPLATREAELRFEVMQGQETSTTQIADYLVATPADQVRDFQVLTRFKSPEEAEQGVQYVRKQYDDFKDYQARMMQSMRQATSMRRC